MTDAVQRIVFDGSSWSCAWCAAELHDATITHRADCRWIAEVRAQGAATERERIRQLVATWRAMAAEPETRRSTMAQAMHTARTGAYEGCAAALADLLDGTP